MSDRNSNALKDAFAAALLRSPNDPFKAAVQVFGSDTAKALIISREWPRDQYVLSKQAELLEQFGEESFLPSKQALARQLFEIGTDAATDRKDRINAFRLYAEIMNYIDKGGVTVDNRTVNVSNRVMVIKDFGSDDDWERKTIDQQARLIANARN